MCIRSETPAPRLLAALLVATMLTGLGGCKKKSEPPRTVQEELGPSQQSVMDKMDQIAAEEKKKAEAAKPATAKPGPSAAPATTPPAQQPSPPEPSQPVSPKLPPSS